MKKVTFKKPHQKTFFDKFKKDQEFQKHYKEASELLDVAIKIAQAREEKKMSQKELAELINTDQSVISRIENGRENISLKKLFKIARALNRKIQIKFA